MFFLLSKLLDFALSPLLWVLALLALALLARPAVWRRRGLLGATVLLVVFSNRALANLAWKLWESPIVPVAQVGRYDAAVLLTGITGPFRFPRDRVHVAGGADRLLHTVWLWRRGHFGRIIVAGGSGALVNHPRIPTEAAQLRLVLMSCGVPDSVIVLEDRSRNTRENALFTASLLRARPALAPHGRLLLITSAFHMRRAEGCFRRAGLAPAVFPTDYVGQYPLFILESLTPTAAAFFGWERLIHEIFGYFTYRLLGYC